MGVILTHLINQAIASVHRREDGAIGWLVVGILIGVVLVIFGIIKFVIPGD